VCTFGPVWRSKPVYAESGIGPRQDVKGAYPDHHVLSRLRVEQRGSFLAPVLLLALGNVIRDEYVIKGCAVQGHHQG